MKTVLSVGLALLFTGTCAQTPVNKTMAVRPGQKVSMHFDYPELVRISTWDKNEISVQGTVSINGGENDDAFVLNLDGSGATINIRSEIRDMKNLPHRITVVRDGQKVLFKNKAEFKKYCAENGTTFNRMSDGVDMDITLEVKVPRNMETHVESVYSIVEVREFTGPLTVEATYGGVDAAVEEKSMGKLTAETNYGQIYTNLNIAFDRTNIREEAFHTLVSAQPGSGPPYSFESKYGNVYLRRSH